MSYCILQPKLISEKFCVSCNLMCFPICNLSETPVYTSSLPLVLFTNMSFSSCHPQNFCCHSVNTINNLCSESLITKYSNKCNSVSTADFFLLLVSAMTKFCTKCIVNYSHQDYHCMKANIHNEILFFLVIDILVLLAISLMMMLQWLLNIYEY